MTRKRKNNNSKYFSNCCTLQQLKSEYKKLVKLHHPDNGGSADIIKSINTEYERLKKILPDDIETSETSGAAEFTSSKTSEAVSNNLSEVLQEIIEKVSKIPDIMVEICGTWLWISGNTFPVKDILKNLGFKFSGKKKMWYFHEEEENFHYRRKREKSMEDIRNTYGSEKVHYNTASALS